MKTVKYALLLLVFCGCSHEYSSGLSFDDMACLLEGKVVCIDPGHQQYENPAPEPVAPGSASTKPGVSSGTAGTVTGIPEYVITLQMGQKLKKLLENSGATVVMTREQMM